MILTKETFDGVKAKQYFLGIPTWKLRIHEDCVVIMLFGIKLCSFKVKLTSKRVDVSMCKAFELLETRQNCDYENKESL